MIKLAIVGVGNCASALVQGIAFYRKTNSSEGLIIPTIFGFEIGDIEVVAAFDVDARKTGKLINDAIFAGDNNTLKFCKPLRTRCIVTPAPRFDGIGDAYERQIDLNEGSEADVRSVLKRTQPDVLVNYLPVGSDMGTRYWAQICIELKIGFVNAIPSFIVSTREWCDRFFAAGVACAGDDVKSQVGATAIHRALMHAFVSRGGKLSDSYQLNFGGNMDFKNMMQGNRLASKRASKMKSVIAELRYEGACDTDRIYISPTDYVGYLKDNKIAYINMRGTGFGGAPIEIETKLSVWDSPNSAAVVADVIRFVAGAMREGVAGALPICDYYFKSPPEQVNDTLAEEKARDYASRGTFRS